MTFTILAALALVGCLGGEHDVPTVANRSLEFSLPPLKLGDKWVVEESGTEYEEAVTVIEVVDEDTVFNATPAYALAVRATIPRYATARGDSVWNFVQTGLILMRKSDQETLYDSLHVNSEVRFAGDTVKIRYQLLMATRSEPQAVPTLLRPGMTWSVANSKSRTSVYFLDDAFSGGIDTSWVETRLYAAGLAGDVRVKAGLFYALEIGWTREETGEASTGWFSEDARTYVKEVKTEAGQVTSSYELSSLSLK